MPPLILPLALLAQCKGVTCYASAVRYEAATVRPQVVYQAAPQACTVPRRGFKLFRKCR